VIDHSNLEEFERPDEYDDEYGALDGDGAFYVELAREIGGPVLDVACGTGRVAVPIARLGVPVVGVDLCLPMLERARAKSAGLPVRYVTQDARAIDLPERFALAIMTGHAVQAMLTDDDQRRLLAAVARHLRPGGRFAFETRNPCPAHLTWPAEREHWHSYVTADGRIIDVSGCAIYDPLTHLQHCTTFRTDRARTDQAPGRERTARIALRYTDESGLRARLAEAGLTVLASFGDWDRSSVTPDSPEIVFVCEKP
jgi:SAM-dependent methyltransferase